MCSRCKHTIVEATDKRLRAILTLVVDYEKEDSSDPTLTLLSIIKEAGEKGKFARKLHDTASYRASVAVEEIK